MKRITVFILTMVATLPLVIACDLFKLDNYDAPEGELAGRIIDEATGENVQTDIIDGTQLALTELAYPNSTPTYLRVKRDGSYAKALLFPGKYMIVPTERNFYNIEEEEITIKKKGITEHDFTVIPYLRVKNVEIVKELNTVYATFSVQSTGDDVSAIALFASPEANVGEAIYSVCEKVSLNRWVDDEEVFTIGINVAANSVYFKENHEYYFRVGALSNVGGAKYNYATAQKMNIGEFIEEPEPEYHYFDHCDSVDGWGPGTPTLDTVDKREGEASVRIVTEGPIVAERIFEEGETVDAGVSMSKGIFEFDLYVSDASVFNWDDGDSGIEITSGGQPDSQELSWKFNSERRISSGWNRLSLKLADATANGGTIDLTNINYLRIYHTNRNGDVYTKIDNIRFYEK